MSILIQKIILGPWLGSLLEDCGNLHRGEWKSWENVGTWDGLSLVKTETPEREDIFISVSRKTCNFWGTQYTQYTIPTHTAPKGLQLLQLFKHFCAFLSLFVRFSAQKSDISRRSSQNDPASSRDRADRAEDPQLFEDFAVDVAAHRAAFRSWFVRFCGVKCDGWEDPSTPHFGEEGTAGGGFWWILGVWSSWMVAFWWKIWHLEMGLGRMGPDGADCSKLNGCQTYLETAWGPERYPRMYIPIMIQLFSSTYLWLLYMMHSHPQDRTGSLWFS